MLIQELCTRKPTPSTWHKHTKRINLSSKSCLTLQWEDFSFAEDEKHGLEYFKDHWMLALNRKFVNEEFVKKLAVIERVDIMLSHWRKNTIYTLNSTEIPKVAVSSPAAFWVSVPWSNVGSSGPFPAIMAWTWMLCHPTAYDAMTQ